ncbi:Peptidyl-prolyl cis-trans isomerase SurA [Halorhodospira halochloris]|uniref:Chaperone SurA n=1 Tax=Halorhodospira halochloris TaxID=1052 RepID=A0A0X8X7Q2_HALHR|nr:peptidylprolyl isomerase [Halorhodospira halochloris]MBK1650982.1 molecular chaperone SurA [Halorhodospira halochloris]BAU56508.1 Peptidyl-prolyl cis-trans isomerase SurA [Halorhodospira halochloris]
MQRLTVITVLIALLTATGVLASERLDRIVAVADQEIVLASELEREVQGIQSQLMQQGQPLPDLDQLRRQVLERLVMQRLQLAHAQRAGVRIDDATLDAAMQRIAAQNNMTLTQLRSAVAQQGMDFAEFRSGLRDEIAISQLHQAIVQQEVDVSPREIEDAVEAAAAQDNIEYLVAHIRVGTPEGASPEQLQSAEERAKQLREQALEEDTDFQSLAETFSDAASAEDGGVLSWRLPGQLPGSIAEPATELETGEISQVIQAADGFHIVKLLDKRREDAQIVEETKSRHILLQTDEGVTDDDVRQRLESFLERIEEGESFEYLARMYSEDPGSEADGGNIGWTSPGQLVPEFQEQLDKLEPGETSEPFQTQYGWHIVRVEERRERDVTDEQRREQIAQQIFERKSQEALEQWQRQLREESYVDYRLESP